MPSQPTIARCGLLTAILLLVSTLTILYRGSQATPAQPTKVVINRQ